MSVFRSAAIVSLCAAAMACGFTGAATGAGDAGTEPDANTGEPSHSGDGAGTDASASDATPQRDGETVFLDGAVGLPPELAVTVTTPPAALDLETEGTLAWQHWGKDNTGSRNEKTSAKGAIPTFTLSGTNDLRTFGDYITSFSWENGSPNPTENGTKNGVYGKRDGMNMNPKFTLMAKVGVESRRLVIYAGTFQCKARLTAKLSSPTFTKVAFTDIDSANDTQFNKAYGRFAIDYRGNSPMMDLVITWEMSASYDDNNSNVTLSAATLVPR